MSNAHAQGGWTVSEVEQLTGLSRRDIQRCCYQGKGGVGILDPRDSSWGRRTYDAHDVATLFVVRLEKQAGLSLPEAASKLREWSARNPDSGVEVEMLAAHVARLGEKQEEIAGQLLAARALLLALRDESPDAIGKLVERETQAQLVEAFPTLNGQVDEQNEFACGKRESDQKLSRDTSKHRAGQLANRAPSRDLIAKHLAPLAGTSATSQDAYELAVASLAEVIDGIHETGGISHTAGKQALTWALDAPGMALAIELWLGPGTYTLLMRALS